MFQGFQTSFVNAGWWGCVYTLRGWQTLGYLTPQQRLCEEFLSCDPQHHLLGSSDTRPAEQGSSSRSADISVPPSYGTLLADWHGFGDLENNMGLEQRSGESALCYFCEDHVVMQGKQSCPVCMGPLPRSCAIRAPAALLGLGVSPQAPRTLHRWLRDAGGGKQKEARLCSVIFFSPSTRQERGHR